MANQIVIEVDYKDAIVKLNDLEGKIRDLRIPFEELGKANEQAASRVRAAVNSMGDAVAGSIKNLQRQRAEHINIAESLSKTNSQYRENMQIVAALDAKIAKLTDTRTRAQKAADAQAAAEAKLGQAIKGSAADIQNQIRLLELEQNNRKKSNTQYRALQKEIDKLRSEYKALTNTMQEHEVAQEGSIGYYKQEIALLQQKQQNLAKDNEEYRKLQVTIDEHTASIRELSDVRKEEQIVVDGSPAYYKQLIFSLQEEQANLANTTELYAEYEMRIAAARREMSKLNPKFQDLTKAQVSTAHSAGAAGSAATEFTRVIQDAPYGIQGVANNIEQLGSQFADLVNKTGSSKNAFKELTKTLFGGGPNTFLLALSLVTAGITYFTRRKQEAEQKTKDFTDAMILETKTLQALSGAFNDANASMEDKAEIIGALSAADKKYAEQLKALAGDEEARIQFTNEYIAATINLKKAEEEKNDIYEQSKDVNLDDIMTMKEREVLLSTLAVNERELTNAKEDGDRRRINSAKFEIASINERIQKDKDARDANQELAAAIDATAKAQEELDRVLKQTEMDKYLEKFAEFQKEQERQRATRGKEGSEAIQIEIDLLEKEMSALIDAGKQGTVEVGELNLKIQQKILEKENAVYEEQKAANEKKKEDEKDFYEFLADMMEEDFLRTDMHGLAKLELEKVRALERAKLAGATNDQLIFIEQFYAAKIKEINDELDVESFQRAEKVKKERLGNIKDEYDAVVEGINKQADAIRQSYDNALEWEQKRHDKMTNIMQQSSTIIDELSQISISRFERQIGYINQQMDLVRSNNSLTKEERERQIDELQARENAVQENRIKAERDMFTIKQGIALAEMIMQERMSFMAWQRAQREKALIQAVSRARLKANNDYLASTQAVNAALTVEQGKQAITGVTLGATEAAADASMSIGEYMKQLGPFGIAAFALSIGGVIASIVSARKKAKAEIANLTGVGGSAGGGVTPSIPPDFRVVGASGVNQLAEVINGQTNQPVKAYVVSDDVTSAQSLNRNIVEGASI